MKTIIGLVIAALLAAPIASAQEANLYDGTWKTVLEGGKKGGNRSGLVVLKDRGGTWDIDWSLKNNPCAGIRAPIVIQRASAEELVFQIKRSEALKGCKDNIATLKRVNEATLEGALDDGRALTMNKR